jgi:hypothetical protein
MADLTEKQRNLLKKVYYDQKILCERDKLYHLIKSYSNHPTKVQVFNWLLN